MKHAGRGWIDAGLKKHGARRYTEWASTILDALDERTIVVVGTDATVLIIPFCPGN